MSHKVIKYGCKRDAADFRDKIMKLGAAPSFDGLPAKVDLRAHCSPVEDQSTLGSCTANASVGALEYLEIKNGLVGPKFENFSRLYVYYNTRVIEKTVNEDSGASIRNAVKSIVTWGSCDETKWPYDISKFTVQPPKQCYDEGKKHRVMEYHRLENLPDMLKCLADGYPFIFGFSVYSAFEGQEVATTGILNLPQPNETFMGGHAVLAVGYDLDAKTVLIRNSWGTNWGQQGYFTMPFSYISNPTLAHDFWTVRK